MSRQVILAAALAIVLAPAARAADEVELKKKNRKTGKPQVQTGIVSEDNRSGVTLKIGGGGHGSGPSLQFGASEVREVRYANTPYYYWSAKRQLEGEDYKAALKNLNQIIKKEKFNPLFLQYVLYNVAKCYTGMGKHKEAVAAYEDLLKKDPDTRFFTEAIVKIVESHMKVRAFEKASDWLPKLREAGDKYRGLARLYRAKILEAQGKYSPAKETYKEVSEDESGDLKGEATVGVARCDFARKQYEGARRTAERVVSDDVSFDIIARAHIVIGNSLYETAKAAGDKEKMKEALTSFLRVVVLYKGYADTEPEALLRAGQCFEYIKGTKDRGRAKDMYTRLVRRYPGSRHVEEAQRGLSRVK